MRRVQNPNLTPWTEAEEATLRATYRDQDYSEAKLALPQRSTKAIQAKAFTLGLTRSHRWTRAEVGYLRTHWGTKSINAIAAALGRPRCGVYRAAMRAGIKLGVPQGFEGLGAAAKRCGFSRDSMRRVMRWARQHVVKVPSRAKSRCYSHEYVDPWHADAAVAAWTRSETIEDAVQRLHVSRRVLLELLRADGCVEVLFHKRKCRIRVLPEVVDRVVAAYRGQRVAA